MVFIQKKTRFCPECGAHNNISDSFCQKCGAELKKESFSSINTENNEIHDESKALKKSENELNDIKAIEQLTNEVKDQKMKNEIYGCILCLGLTIGTAVTYTEGGGIAATVILGGLVVPSMILWIQSWREYRRLQKEGLTQLKYIGTVKLPDYESEVNNTKQYLTETCMVCQSPISSVQELYECMKCNYKAHKIHFLLWFKEHSTCPNCNK